MKNARRILALIGVILLVAMYAMTLVFALMKHPLAPNFLMAAVYCTIAVPVMLFAMIQVAKYLEQKGRDLADQERKRHESEEREQPESEPEDPGSSGQEPHEERL